MEPTRSEEARRVRYSEAEREAIRKQLERMLANPLFKNSKRYPNLLRYVVEHTLERNPGELKERTLGVEVFGREPNYDTNADPVVRATAGEIRKRIAQYYHEHGRENEIRMICRPAPTFRSSGCQPRIPRRYRSRQRWFWRPLRARADMWPCWERLRLCWPQSPGSSHGRPEPPSIASGGRCWIHPAPSCCASGSAGS